MQFLYPRYRNSERETQEKLVSKEGLYCVVLCRIKRGYSRVLYFVLLLVSVLMIINGKLGGLILIVSHRTATVIIVLGRTK